MLDKPISHGASVGASTGGQEVGEFGAHIKLVDFGASAFCVAPGLTDYIGSRPARSGGSHAREQAGSRAGG